MPQRGQLLYSWTENRTREDLQDLLENELHYPSTVRCWGCDALCMIESSVQCPPHTSPTPWRSRVQPFRSVSQSYLCPFCLIPGHLHHPDESLVQILSSVSCLQLFLDSVCPVCMLLQTHVLLTPVWKQTLLWMSPPPLPPPSSPIHKVCQSCSVRWPAACKLANPYLILQILSDVWKRIVQVVIMNTLDAFSKCQMSFYFDGLGLLVLSRIVHVIWIRIIGQNR